MDCADLPTKTEICAISMTFIHIQAATVQNLKDKMLKCMLVFMKYKLFSKTSFPQSGRKK